jgi:hypothetical protein
MATIDSETTVVVTMKHLLWGVGLMLGGGAAVLWTVLTFTIGGVRDDLSGIRAELGDLRKAALAVPQEELTLNKNIEELKVELDQFRSDFATIQVSLNDVKGQVDSFKKSPPKKSVWTTDDSQKVVDGLTKAGFSKDKFVVVPLLSKD